MGEGERGSVGMAGGGEWVRVGGRIGGVMAV